MLTAALAACGSSSSSSSGNGVAGKSPDEIVNAAINSVSTVKSVHVSGMVTDQGMPITLDLNLASGQGGTGTLAQNGLSFQIVAVNQTVYINGSQAFWEHFGGAAAAKLFQGKWLKAPATGQFSSFAQLTNPQQLLTKVLSSHGSLTKGSTSTVNGQPVIAVHDASHGGTLYVATTGPAYPIQVTGSGAQSLHLTFDKFNEPVTLTPPSGAIDISQLTGK
jgi:hypothetical protein